MWAIRLLNGPSAGQVIQLKVGRNLIGRGPQCDIKISNNGVSKEHCEIKLSADRLTISDLKSSNGTFVNGIKIQNSFLKIGDRIGLFDVIIELIEPSKIVQKPSPISKKQIDHPIHHPVRPIQNNEPDLNEMDMNNAEESEVFNPENKESFQDSNLTKLFSSIHQKIQEYMERVVLPGVYKLPQIFEFRYVLWGFTLVFILMATLLSMIPMVSLTRDGIMHESRRRATSLAKTLGAVNQAAILQDSLATLTINPAADEDGVKQVLIVRHSDGSILAPASRAGFVADIPFVHMARQENKAFVMEIDRSTIGASYPIGSFDPNLGEQVIKAHVIVIYDVSSLALDEGLVISLFMQTLLLSFLVGGIIFYFMFKIIDYPIKNLNDSLDKAMRDKRDDLSLKFNFPSLQNLISNINSLLTRNLTSDFESIKNGGSVNKHAEAENISQLVGYPCLLMSGEGLIMASNHPFDQLTRSSIQQMQGRSLDVISDIALKQNIESLISKSKDMPQMIHRDHLEFSGHNFLLSCSASVSNSGIDYFLVVVSPIEEGSS